MASGKRPRLEATLVTMGEAMLRLHPIDAEPPSSPSRHRAQPFLRSVGGDELNVAVALSLVGVKCRWISVVPNGPLGDAITDSCTHYGVEFAGIRTDGDIGMYTVLPELKTVHYQRRWSVWAMHDPAWLQWEPLLQENDPSMVWLHVTGITPLISESSYQSWCNVLEAAAKGKLGSLETLWGRVASYIAAFQVVILSLDQLNGLMTMQVCPTELATDADDEACSSAMMALQAKWGCKRVCLCRKLRDQSGVQRRWSQMTVMKGAGEFATYSTFDIPVYHTPKDECGGGSAWAAGMLHSLHIAALDPPAALRRADLLAALCQQTAGDFSDVKMRQLRSAERMFNGKAAWLVTKPEEPAAFPAAMETNAAAAAIEHTLLLLKRAGVERGKLLHGSWQISRLHLHLVIAKVQIHCGVVAILRAKGDVDLTIARGLELAAMGCRAIEVTLDSSDWKAVLEGLRKALPPNVILGVGTVVDETVCQIGFIKSLGASFALSPIDPTGFLDECHRHGILAIPSAFTSNECWQLHRRGCRMIKLFHAGLLSPAILKSMLDVTPLGQNLNILPSGGVSPSNASQWWDAGAACLGMGSNLVGKDISVPRHSPAFMKASADWSENGRAIAEQLFKEVSQRF